MELGKTVADTVTGFRGTLTGIAQYLDGTSQGCVAAPSVDGKMGEVGWIDSARLVRD